MRNTPFSWVGLDRTGRRLAGNIRAKNKLFARIALSKQGISVNTIKHINRLCFNRTTKLREEEVTAFIRQLGILLGAHIPLTRALDTLIHTLEQPRWHDLLTTLLQQIEAGHSLANALRHYPAYFNVLVCDLVTIGEQSASLAYTLNQLALEREQWFTLKQHIKSQLRYPLTLLCLTSAVTCGLLLYVVPQFAQFFQQFNAPLPGLTQWILACARGIQHTGPSLLGLLVITSVVLRYLYQNSKALTYAVDQLLLNLPGIGFIIQCATMARLANTLSTALQAGLPLTEALHACVGIIRNRCLQDGLRFARVQIVQGNSLSNALKLSGRFLPRFVQLVTIGEESGVLDGMLSHLGKHYQRELELLMQQVSQWLEPLLMTVLGGFIGTVIIALYLPIFQLGAIL